MTNFWIKPRLTLRSSLILIAVVAVLLAIWNSYFDPVRAWKRSIRDDDNGALRWDSGANGVAGKIPGVSPEMAVSELIQALSDPSFRVRETSAAILGRTGAKAEPAIGPLIVVLRDPDPMVRLRAVSALGEILRAIPERRGVIVPELIDRLKDPHFATRLASATALASVGEGKAALPVLVEGLRQPDFITRALTISAISQAGRDAKPAESELLRVVSLCASDPDPWQRMRAIEGAVVLISLGANFEGQRVLSEAMNDVHPAVRKQAEVAWENFGPGDSP